MDVSQLTDRLVAGAYQGQICGAHVSGKSTLLMELQQELARRGIPVSRVDRPESQRAMLTRRLWQARRARQVVVVDGFERLRDGERAVVTGMARWWQSGLLVTCHRRGTLPLLWETEVSLPVATAVVRHLTQDDAAAWAVASQQLETRLAAQRGDLRETLFELYDVCQGLAI
ncbi:MAG: ATP-binding protein [Planctomycetota bacterium]